MSKEKTYKEKFGVNEFIPTENNPTPWKVIKSSIWQKVVSTNGKTVCNCRNIKDAELLVNAVNKLTHPKQ